MDALARAPENPRLGSSEFPAETTTRRCRGAMNANLSAVLLAIGALASFSGRCADCPAVDRSEQFQHFVAYKVLTDAAQTNPGYSDRDTGGQWTARRQHHAVGL